jgi:NAD(P)-dependent dehydrogenase (short-subunit alcohol dehydrogenase family)
VIVGQSNGGTPLALPEKTDNSASFAHRNSTMENPMTKVWLVTGSASGLGRNIAEAVLASGDRLVATARDPRRLEDLVEKYGDQIRTAPLDVADEDAAYRAVQVALEAFGRLDVVKVAQVVLRLAASDRLPAHLLLGSDAVQYAGQAEATRAADAERWRETSVSTDVNAPASFPALRF